MDLAEAHALAGKLIDCHLSAAWTFRFDGAEARFGHCSYNDRTIQLSRELTRLNPREQVRDTLLHEIAHALVGPTDGSPHGTVWQQTAAELGASPNRCYSTEQVHTPTPRWRGRCPGCDRTITRHQLAASMLTAACQDCRQALIWTIPEAWRSQHPDYTPSSRDRAIAEEMRRRRRGLEPTCPV